MSNETPLQPPLVNYPKEISASLGLVTIVSVISLVRTFMDGGVWLSAGILAGVVITAAVSSFAVASWGRRSAKAFFAVGKGFVFVAGVLAVFAGGWWPWLWVLLLVGCWRAASLALDARRRTNCSVSKHTIDFLDADGTVNWERTGVGGLVLVEGSRGGQFLVGEITGEEDSFDTSTGYHNFLVLLGEQRRTETEPDQLGGIVVIADLKEFGPLRMVGSDNLIAVSVDRLPIALTRRLRGGLNPTL